MNTTASRPSRRTVTNGKRKNEYRCRRTLQDDFLIAPASMALASLIFHFSCIRSVRSIAKPIIVIMTVAIKEKTPSQISSELPQISFRTVYQTAIKAAPMQRHMKRPRAPPSQTWFRRRLYTGVPFSKILDKKDKRTETMIDASVVSRNTIKKMGTLNRSWDMGRSERKGERKDNRIQGT